MNRLLPLIIPILMTAGCSRHETVLAAKSTQQTPATVHIETVAVSQIPDVYRASGTVRARQIAAIA